jgi:PBSX family phage terminase large subunit
MLVLSLLRIKYNPLPAQARFHKSQSEKVAFIGGYGSGKSYSLIMHMLKLANLNKGCPIGLLCPTLKMAKRDVIPTFREIARDNRIHHKYNKSESTIYLPQTKTDVWVFHGEDDGQSIKGPNLAAMLINEFTLITENTYLAALARVRHPKATFRQVAMSGTFEEFGGVYDLITEDKTVEIINGSTRENTFLPNTYVKMLENSYDEDLQKQYIDGLPVRRLGKVAAKSFRRDHHVSDISNYDSQKELWISIDFNVEPMSAVLWSHSKISYPKLMAFDEVALFSSDTPELARVLKHKLQELERDINTVTLFPDPAGNARSTKGLNRTDVEILREAGFKDIRYRRRIMSVKDCMNAVNNLFDSNEIVINPKCRNLIADLEQIKWKDSGFEFDKSNSKRSHWLDGMKDMIEYEYQVIKPKVMRGPYTR